MSTTPRTAPDDVRGATAATGDGRVERLVGHLLRFGVLSSLLLVVAGTLLTFAHGASYEGAVDDLRRVTAVELSATPVVGSTPGRALVAAGLLLLIATPVLRVVVSLVTFAVQRDWPFVLLAGVVLALLAVSFATGALR